jgi:hypothetical protein
MRLFILTKELYIKGRIISKEYLKTCVDRKSAEDTIQHYLSLLCMRTCANMRVFRMSPHHWVIKDYCPETEVVTNRFEYWITEVDI